MTLTRHAVVPAELAGRRLDKALAAIFPDATRSQLQQWIEAGLVRVDGAPARKRDKLRGGETIELDPPPVREAAHAAQAIPFEIVYEDDEILVVNKPPGLVVHPGAGNPEGTLLNALLHHAPAQSALARAGIVHRLDKDTSGLLVVAKTERARQALVLQLQDKSMGREYVALVHGVMIAGGTVNARIGRHRADRRRMAVTGAGKDAVSHYRVMKKYRAHTLVQVTLESGRTHQIRVHMAHLKFPVVGDPTYGGRSRVPKGASESLLESLRTFKRQALHAVKLRLVHPATGKTMQWAAPVPLDMSRLMEELSKDVRRAE
ncbi:MAG TPA: 23S rRNA pseudouridine(1911/1915/1917) synthase RluD [Burkholderiales bacterium]|nr:23S rRNA pseudouridine(1911/1915/1917) synthase RluD [Burkholderiales bacterium]